MSNWNLLWENTFRNVQALAASVDMKVERHDEPPYGWDLIDADGDIHETGSVEWITSYLNTLIAARKQDPEIEVLRGVHWRRSSHAADCGKCIEETRYIETIFPSNRNHQHKKEA